MLVQYKHKRRHTTELENPSGDVRMAYKKSVCQDNDLEGWKEGEEGFRESSQDVVCVLEILRRDDYLEMVTGEYLTEGEVKTTCHTMSQGM